ncbi:hypothetical protein EAP07_04385 [Salmonella enterica]|nr:hypothetical protein [Salmonella enterica]EAS6367248.1 hypothetical protein [Salmonella enterica]
MMPGLYGLSEHHRTLASLSEMSASKIAPVINFSESDVRPKSIYTSNMRIIHQRLSQAVAEGNTNVIVPLHEGLNDVGEVEFIEVLSRNSVLVKKKLLNLLKGGCAIFVRSLKPYFILLTQTMTLNPLMTGLSS